MNVSRLSLEQNCQLGLPPGEGLLKGSCGSFAVSLCERVLQARDLTQQFDLHGRASGTLQNRVRHPQVFRSAEIVLEIERLPGAGQVIEFAFGDGFSDSVLGEAVERHRARLSHGRRLAVARENLERRQVDGEVDGWLKQDAVN